MKIIIGLGNPGKEYSQTYHNIGFMVVDELAKDFGAQFLKKGFKSVYCEVRINNQKVMLVKPQTYMNNSGECVILLKNKFKDSKILVVVDDIDTQIGKVKYKEHGSGGTHNGLRNIVDFVGENFERIKVGIGQPQGDLKNFVLQNIDKPFKDEIIPKACSKVKEWLNG